MQILAETVDSGLRLDVFIANKVSGLSRSAVQSLIEAGAVTVGSKAVKKNYKIAGNEMVSLIMPVPRETELKPEAIDLDIVFEDTDLIVINKPKGMVVHPAPGHYEGTLVNALMAHCCGSLSGIGGVLRPGIVHRLDKDTSGLMVVAKNDFTHLALSTQLAERSISRVYELVIRGHLKTDTGTIDLPIGRSYSDRKKMAVNGVKSRNAVTHYELIREYTGWSHIRCKLETGRTHQIRVHMAHIGHPVLGDSVYGSKKPEIGLESQCLHSKNLRFSHPRSNTQLQFASDLPKYFIAVLEKLERF